ncbi:MAG: hypothetical protein IJO29_07480 [Oscillospiraceae bacterium]|nr:hypothetical protein [Oscillospiraceae bacterium]
MKNSSKKLITIALICALGSTALCSCKERLDAPPGEASSSLSQNMLYNDYANLEKVTGEDAKALHKGTLTITCGEQQITPVEYITALYEEGDLLYNYTRDSVGNMQNLPEIDCTDGALQFVFENETYKNITYQLWTLDQNTLVDDDHDGSPSEKFVMPTASGTYFGAAIVFWEDGNGQTVLSEYFFRFTC